MIGGIKAIFGGTQKRKAQKELDKETPKYSRPEEYSKLLSVFEQQANLGKLPGQEGVESALSERTARGVRAIGKYAGNSAAALSSVSDLYGREQSAVRDLGTQFASFQNANKRALADAYKQGADYSDKEFSYNEWYPDQMKRNMAAQKWNAGQQNLWGGIDQMGAAGIDAATAALRMGKTENTAGTGTGAGAGLGAPSLGSTNMGGMPGSGAFSYFNPQLNNQFVPQFGTSIPQPKLGAEWNSGWPK